MSKIVIFGGAFQDPEGNPLANGVLYLQLNHDAVVINTGQIVSEIVIAIPLDADGNAPDTALWFNDQLSPSGTAYVATLFSASGQDVWQTSQLWVFTGSSPINLDSMIPYLGGVLYSTVVPAGLSGGIQYNDHGSFGGLPLGTAGQVLESTGSGSVWTDLPAPPSLSYMWGAGFSEIPTSTGSNVIGTAINDQVYAFKFQLTMPITISKCSYIWGNIFIGPGGISFAIYDSNKNILVDPGFFDTNGIAADTLTTLSFDPVTLPPGVYYFAQSVSFNGLNGPNVSYFTFAGLVPDAVDLGLLINAGDVRYGTSSNLRVANVMPSSLGTLTAVADPTNTVITMPLWRT